MTDKPPKFKFKKPSNASLKKKKLRRTTNPPEQEQEPVEENKLYVGGQDGEQDLDGIAKADNAGETTPSDAAAKTDIGKSTVKDSSKVDRQNNKKGDDEDEPSALNAILAVERRRKLLGTGRSRGVDAVSLIKNTKKKSRRGADSDSSEAVSDANATRNKDLEERLKGTFSEGKLAGSNDMGGDEEGGILAKKHRKAMEEFIQKNMDGAAASVGGSSKNGSENGGGGEALKRQVSDVEKELYAELITTSGAGLDPEKSGKDAGANADAGEGDVGAGGTMMGGTGIAEVTLPIDERIKALKETEKAALAYEQARRARFGMRDERDGSQFGEDGVPEGGFSSAMVNSEFLAKKGSSRQKHDYNSMVPMSFASGPGKRRRQDVALPETYRHETNQTKTSDINSSINATSSTIPSFSASSAGFDVQRSDVSTLGASYSHNFQLHTREWVSRRRDERQSEIDAIQAQREAEEGQNTESRGRLGFEMARKLAKGEIVAPAGSGDASSSGVRGPNGETLRNEWDRKSGGGDQRSSDDRVWKTFMSKQRNRR